MGEKSEGGGLNGEREEEEVGERLDGERKE